MKLVKSLGKYNKFWMALATVLITGLAQVYGQNQWVQLIIALAGSVGVYGVTNRK